MSSLFETSLPRVLGFRPFRSQTDAIEAPPSACLFIVAGAGSGKTTVLALRTLSLILVAEYDPGSIVATTFTRKAAKELRSRILSWGDQFRNYLLSDKLASVERTRLEGLDFNAVVTGTIDSIAETIMAQHRAPGTQPPVVIEDFVSRALMLRRGLFAGGRFRAKDLGDYVVALGVDRFGLNAAALANAAYTVHERMIHDGVDVERYRTEQRTCTVCGEHPHPGIDHTCDSIADYLATLEPDDVLDYARLEEHFLARLCSGALVDFTDRLRALLVDEYQDTNLLQERIYFRLAKRTIAQGGGLTVVGDDDQSLFRFRGATVDLFHAFPERLMNGLGTEARTMFLTENSRSTQAIVDHCNDFITLDAGFQAVRVEAKPPIRFERDVPFNLPILGLFRQDVPTLARDTAQVIDQVFQGSGLRLPTGHIIRKGESGSVADCALLLHSPAEFRGNRQRLPLLLRQELLRLTPPVETFNPRGQQLAALRHVGQLCGLILECIDPEASVQTALRRPPPQAMAIFDAWRAHARALVATSPEPRVPRSLPGFVRNWQDRQTSVGASRWPNEVPLAELAYKLVTWIPPLQDDIEALVHLELVIRTITEASRFSPYSGYVVFRTDQTEQASVRSALWDIFIPIALGAVEVEEDLLETLPRDRLNVLSIHQSKGLEFPMVIVDVGSDFRINHARQTRSRFPSDGDLTHKLEDELRQFSPLPPTGRSGRDRAFDDLVRLYFVAFSRARDVLVLAGLSSVKDSIPSEIPNVATGWDRHGTWRWGAGLPNLVQI